MNESLKLKSVFWKIFRLTFVLFSLYLLGDAFYRWDGFSYYAPFSKFLPSVALVLILWSLVAVLTAVMIWILFKAIEWLCSRTGWKIKSEHFMLCIGILGLLVSISWIGKRYLLPDLHSNLFDVIVIFCASIVAAMLVLPLSSKAERWMDIIQERITPLVWLFGLFVLFSVPLVAYHTWFKGIDEKEHKPITMQSAADKKRPNFILVTFDALTARNMSAYGYNRETTPYISEWAKSATLFKRTEAESNYTGPTITSLMTGKRVWTHSSYYSEGFSIEINTENMIRELKENGYHNRVYMGNHIASPKALGMEDGYDFTENILAFRTLSFSFFGFIDELISRVFVDKIPLSDWIIKEDFLLYKILFAITPFSSKVYFPPEQAFNDFIVAMEKGEIPEPYFVWFHFYPPHGAYLPPVPYMGMYNSSPEVRTEKSQLKALKTISREDKKNTEEAKSIINLLRDRYDETIRYCDKQIGDFMRRLDVNNISEGSVIILSADHGESFKNRYIGHGGPHLYEQVTHIPLIIKEPEQTERKIVTDLVEQIDIPATILDLAEIPLPSWMEGRSLVPLTRGKKLLPRPAFSMRLDENDARKEITNGTISIWEGDYKFIHYIRENRSILFNLKEDPDEMYDLFQSETEIGNQLLTLTKDNIKRVNEIITSAE